MKAIIKRCLLIVPIIAFLGIPVYAIDVPLYGVFEHTITKKSNRMDVWMDVDINVILTPESDPGRNIEIGGFYYKKNTWKFRFSPDETGVWNWTYDFKVNGATQLTDSGSFTCISSGNPGIVRINPDNSARFVFDDGSPFHTLGLQDCIESVWTGSLTSATWGENHDQTFDQYLSTYRNAGFNLWRLNVNNCSPASYTWNGDVLVPHASNLRTFDEYAKRLRANGFRIYMVLFGWGFDSPTSESQDRYTKMMVDRYGAYVDFWELANEQSTSSYSDATLEDLVTVITNNDPNVHPVSMSNQRPFHGDIEITSPHLYWDLGAVDSYDQRIADDIEDFRPAGKPIVYGEVGNRVICNYNVESFARWRTTLWTAFFRGASIIFWNTIDTDSYCNNYATNLYIGPEMRGYTTVLGSFMNGFDARARRVEELLAVSISSCRAYALSGPQHYGAYIYAGDPTTSISGLNVTINLQSPSSSQWSGAWINPLDGVVDSTVTVQGGTSTTITVPDFTGEIALKLSVDSDENAPPVAVAGDDQTKNVNEDVTLDGSDSSDPDGTIVSYEWREGVTVLAETATATLNFAVGAHTVVLTVTDNEGASSEDSVVITITEETDTDTVKIWKAEYWQRKGRLTVEAATDDPDAALTVVGFGLMSFQKYDSKKGYYFKYQEDNQPNPGTVTVESSKGGVDTLAVTIK